MFLLVSIEQAKQALHIDGSADDATIEMWVAASSLAVVKYLKGEAGDFLGIDSPPNSPPNDLSTVDPRVVAAVIMLTGIFYREPDGDEARDFAYGRLPAKVSAMLYPLRVPTVA